MPMRFQTGALAAMLLLAAAGAARADIVTYTYRGHIVGGTDETGVFGVPGRDLDGLDFRAVFRRDDATPGASAYADAIQSSISGFDAASPVTGALTIDGVTWSFHPSSGLQDQHQESDYCGPGCDFETFSHSVNTSLEAFDPGGTVLHRDYSAMHVLGFGIGSNLLSSPDYHTLPAFSGDTGMTLSAGFDIDAFLFDTTLPAYVYQARAHGDFDIASLTVTTGAAVPEPAAWALMIVGFGAAGATLRRRRALAA